MCRICESSAKVGRAADALTAACLTSAGASINGHDKLSEAMTSAFPVEAIAPADFQELMARLDRPGRA